MHCLHGSVITAIDLRFAHIFAGRVAPQRDQGAARGECVKLCKVAHLPPSYVDPGRPADSLGSFFQLATATQPVSTNANPIRECPVQSLRFVQARTAPYAQVAPVITLILGEGNISGRPEERKTMRRTLLGISAALLVAGSLLALPVEAKANGPYGRNYGRNYYRGGNPGYYGGPRYGYAAPLPAPIYAPPVIGYPGPAIGYAPAYGGYPGYGYGFPGFSLGYQGRNFSFFYSR